MDDSDISLAPLQADTVDVRVRTILWAELALAGEHETSKEWHRRLLQSGLLIEGSKAAADETLQAGDPRREIAGVQRLMRKVMTLEEHHAEVNQPGPWNSGAVRMGSTSIVILLGMLYLTGITHHGPVGAASLMCLVAVGAMWLDILRRKREAAQVWTDRLEARDRLRAQVTRLGTRSWVVPLGREIIENTPHLDLIGMWKREVRQHLAPWQARLDALAPLEGLEGLPLELMGEEAAGGDPEGETEARNRIEQLTALEARLEKLEASLLEALRAQRRVAASGALPALEGLDFTLEEVREWLREGDVDPGGSGQNAQQWLERTPRSGARRT